MRAALRAAAKPAHPTSLLACSLATVTAISREFNNFTVLLVPTTTTTTTTTSTSNSSSSWARRVLGWVPCGVPRWASALSYPPSLGPVTLVAANLALLLSVVFFGFDVADPLVYEMIAIRAGWMTVTQLPLVVLMAGKANVVGCLTGTSYERLNWIHRSVARCTLATALVHASYFLRSWARYDYIGRMLATDLHSRRGLGALCVLAWLVLASVAPVRGWRYELFVAQHLVSAVGFLVAVWLHVPDSASAYVWSPVGLWVLDRTVRWAYMVYHNLAVFHPPASPSSVLACRARFRRLDDNTARITIRDPPLAWRPGQHVFVACHSLAPLQQHPFTIASLPSDGRLDLVVRKHAGCTAHIFRHACLCSGSLPSPVLARAQPPPPPPPPSPPLPAALGEDRTVVLDGPYGRLRPLEQFDSVVLLAGSTGAAFTVPLARHLMRLAALGQPIVTRRLRFVWAVKTGAQVHWFSAELGASLAALDQQNDAKPDRNGGLRVDAGIYVTCDPELTFEIDAKPPPPPSSPSSSVQPGAGGDEKTERAGCGPDADCFCRTLAKDEDAIAEVPACSCGQPTPAPAAAAATAGGDGLRAEGKDLLSRASTTAATSSSSSSSVHSRFDLPQDSVTFVSRRPDVKALIERELEHALGESAVVVCGPRGLVHATRAAVVQLSDERAVHKGTGAQGVTVLSLGAE